MSVSYGEWMTNIGVDVGFVTGNDVGPNGLDAVEYGAVWNSSGGPGDGIPGYWDFDGVDDYVLIPDHSTISYVDTDSVTHGVWVWVPSTGNGSDDWSPIFSKGNRNYELRQYSSYQNRLTWDPGASYGEWYDQLPTDEWVFFCVQHEYTGSNVVLRLYHRTSSDSTMQLLDSGTHSLGSNAVYSRGDDPPQSGDLALGNRADASRGRDGRIAGYFSVSDILTVAEMDDAYDAAFVAPVTLTRYEQDDDDILIGAAWTTYTSSSYSGGSAVTTWTAYRNWIEFNFEGPNLTIIGLKGNRGKAEIFIDEVSTAIIDTNGSWLFNTPVYEATDLGAGPHRFRLERIEDGTGGFTFDAVEVDTLLPLVPRLPPNDSKIVLEGTAWDTINNSQRLFGYYRLGTTGSIMRAYFEGDYIRLFGAKGPGRGTFRVSVDGEAPTVIDCDQTDWQFSLPIYYDFNLSSGKHVIELEVLSGYVEFDGLEAETVLTPLDRFDHDDSKILYGGDGWITANDSRFYGAQETLSSGLAGDTCNVAFEGDEVRLISLYGVNRGIANVSIDGQAPTQVDQYNATDLYRYPVFVVDGLGAGPHTMVISSTGTRNPSSGSVRIGVDAVEAETLWVYPTLVSAVAVAEDISQFGAQGDYIELTYNVALDSNQDLELQELQFVAASAIPTSASSVTASITGYPVIVLTITATSNFLSRRDLVGEYVTNVTNVLTSNGLYADVVNHVPIQAPVELEPDDLTVDCVVDNSTISDLLEPFSLTVSSDAVSPEATTDVYGAGSDVVSVTIESNLYVLSPEDVSVSSVVDEVSVSPDTYSITPDSMAVSSSMSMTAVFEPPVNEVGVSPGYPRIEDIPALAALDIQQPAVAVLDATTYNSVRLDAIQFSAAKITGLSTTANVVSISDEANSVRIDT